jgi:sugar lactone lactonase YvrE
MPGDRRSRPAPALILVALALVCWPTAARAEPACSSQAEVRVLVEGRGVLESVGLDRRGRLFFTDSSAGELLMLKRPGARPRLILDGIESPGGLVFRRDRSLLVGFGNGLQQASDGTANPEAGLLKVNTQSGTAEVRAEGLQMANGVARGPGRAIYASNDITGGVDRVRGGRVRLNWAPVESANGMVADRERESLFVNQTFTGGTIQRVPFDDPGAARTWFAADPPDQNVWFDGLTRAGSDRLYVAAVGAGEVWRVNGPGAACVLASLDPFPRGPSDLAFGRKRGDFKPRSLYVTTFGGELLELTGARG